MFDLTKIQKPQRYIGNEWNVIKKSHHKRATVCISYPDLYEVGMSNLGLRIIYGVLNEYKDVVCERVFMPGEDLAQVLREENRRLFSLETKTALSEFEVVGFNFSYELNATNFLHILDLGGIPLHSSERKDTIIMGGGIANPQSLAEFVDVFFLGEFEAVADSFVEVLRKNRDKESRLRAFSQLEGFYVPKFYNEQTSVKRAYVDNLDESFYPRKWLIPNTAIVHDRAQIEIARGCIHKCTFCQARAIYYPYRQRRVSTVLGLAKDIYASSGYEDFSFLSLSASDYSQIEELIDATLGFFQEKRIGLSLPSVRVGDLVSRLYKKLLPLKKTSLTVAVEAARDCMRERLNKNIDIKELFEAAKIVRSLGVRHLKLYFMYGFSDETEEDLFAIGEFIKKLQRESNIDINASINVFIPKPFSLWESMPMQSEEALSAKRGPILNNIPRSRRIKVSTSDIKRSIIEAVVSRADRDFGRVIERVYRKEKEAMMFNQGFNWDMWNDAIVDEGIDCKSYLAAEKKDFPWSFIQ